MCEHAYKSIALGCIMDSHYDTVHCNEIATYAQSISQFEIFWPYSMYFEFGQVLARYAQIEIPMPIYQHFWSLSKIFDRITHSK